MITPDGLDGGIARRDAASRAGAPRRIGWALALGLAVLSPVCAEYAAGYAPSTGDPLELLGGLLIFVPLYGAPALLIREAARRTGMRWPGILALAAAAGVLQAGVIDQSLFTGAYGEVLVDGRTVAPTLIAAWGISAHTALNFVLGHVIWSFGIPIALVEALRPTAAHRPWLRAPGLVVTALLYLAAAALILGEQRDAGGDQASPAQLTAALVVAGLLVAFACTAGRRRSTTVDRPVPPPIAVAAVAFVAALAFNLVLESWTGVAVGTALLVATVVGVVRLAASERWDERHVVALAAGALVARTVIGFLAEPEGAVAPLAKLGHNTVLLVGAVLLGSWAARRAGRDRP